jgi:hypothetical protein
MLSEVEQHFMDTATNHDRINGFTGILLRNSTAGRSGHAGKQIEPTANASRVERELCTC